MQVNLKYRNMKMSIHDLYLSISSLKMFWKVCGELFTTFWLNAIIYFNRLEYKSEENMNDLTTSFN